jgi:hypothetical protein
MVLVILCGVISAEVVEDMDEGAVQLSVDIESVLLLLEEVIGNQSDAELSLSRIEFYFQNIVLLFESQVVILSMLLGVMFAFIFLYSLRLR